MERKNLVIVAVLIAILLGLLIGRLTAPEGFDPRAGLLVSSSREGCITVAAERGSGATFLIVEVIDLPDGTRQTGDLHLVADHRPRHLDHGPREKEICVASEPAAAGMSTTPPAAPHVMIFGAGEARECNDPKKPDDFCTDHFEDYPQPFPPSG